MAVIRRCPLQGGYAYGKTDGKLFSEMSLFSSVRNLLIIPSLGGIVVVAKEPWIAPFSQAEMAFGDRISLTSVLQAVFVPELEVKSAFPGSGH